MQVDDLLIDQRLREAIDHNCTCEMNERGEAIKLCASHALIDDPARRDSFLRHLRFARHTRLRWIRNEHSEPAGTA